MLAFNARSEIGLYFIPSVGLIIILSYLLYFEALIPLLIKNIGLGFNVTLIDKNDPGSMTSHGHACTFADYACVPVNSPDLFREIPIDIKFHSIRWYMHLTGVQFDMSSQLRTTKLRESSFLFYLFLSFGNLTKSPIPPVCIILCCLMCFSFFY